MKLKQVFLVITISVISALTSIAIYQSAIKTSNSQTIAIGESFPVNYAKYQNIGSSEPLDFTKASSAAVPAVVNIKAKISAKKVSRSNSDVDELLGQLLGRDLGSNVLPEQRASGSGVILSEDGYIITNNHVITDEEGRVADDISVTLFNSKTYKAKLIGNDENTDLAVLKISSAQLPHIVFGNSDDLQTGQWVLAIGYPFSLEATVTAGIISATGSNLGVGSRAAKNGEALPRSFIQTDAAVNIGNSGGALVNTKGELVGINTGILSPTGTYAGYSFAIPVNTVKKSVKQIIQSSGIQKGS